MWNFPDKVADKFLMPAMLDWVYDNWNVHPPSVPLTKAMVNALVKASLCINISYHLTAAKSTMIQEAISASLSQIPLMSITGTKKINVIHKGMEKEKVDIKGLDLVQ